MKKRHHQGWKIAITAMLLGTTLVPLSIPALAAEAVPGATAQPSNYGLTDTIRAAVKSVAVETKPAGTQIAAVVRLYNGGPQKVRVPEHELRAVTTDGVAYTLTAGAGNKTSLQPGEIGELVYLAVIDSPNSLSLSQLSFVHVDEYVYPKQVTNLLSIPVSQQVWYASSGTSQTGAAAKGWGEPFVIPGLNSGLRYTPSAITMQYPSAAGTATGGAGTAAGASAAPVGSAASASAGSSPGRVAVVTLLVENPGVGRETIPDFRVDGRSDVRLSTGSRVEQGAVTVDVGEKKYIHYAIPLDTGATLSSLIVTTTESFAQASQNGTAQAVNFDVGRIAITPSTGEQAELPAAANYTLGTPIAFDPLNKLTDSKTEISLMEMHIHDNEGDGFKTVVGKFKLTNRSDMPLPLPSFQAELTGGEGATYRGSRQAAVPATLNPQMSYIINYSFQVPKAETGERLVMKLLDTQTIAPYTSTIASVQTAASAEATGETLQLYPFTVTLNDWSISTSTSGSGGSMMYSYKLALDLSVAQADDVIVDNTFSKLHFELVDTAGRVLGTADGEFTGASKLVSGKQTLTFNAKSEQLDYPLTIHVYEAFDTPEGQSKRYVTTLKQ